MLSGDLGRNVVGKLLEEWSLKSAAELFPRVRGMEILFALCLRSEVLLMVNARG